MPPRSILMPSCARQSTYYNWRDASVSAVMFGMSSPFLLPCPGAPQSPASSAFPYPMGHVLEA
ncbi:hypothetical protein BDZ97DRAFT_1865954 [Flammula alnicola]|nr:hypothetical protein BDZ97DRAFT_1865954 [Flammula alnicola]